MDKIPLFKVAMADVGDALQKTLQSGYIGQGEVVDRFEFELSETMKWPYINTVDSCTSALHLAIHMAKDGVRNEILCTPLTCAATNMPVVANGLRIRWVDVDPKTCNMDLEDLDRKLSNKTLAVLPVHWGGYPLDLDRLDAIIKRTELTIGKKITVIEDCAHAFGATYKGRWLGRHGHFCCFSFQAIKHLTTGDGGMLTCPTVDSYKRAKLLRWYGMDRVGPRIQQAKEWGFKFHMNDINATIGLGNLQQAIENLKKHQENASILRSKLSAIPGLSLFENKPDRTSADWIFSVCVEGKAEFEQKLWAAGIAAGQVHGRNDALECFSCFREPLPQTDILCQGLTCIPCGWWLTKSDLQKIVRTIKSGW